MQVERIREADGQERDLVTVVGGDDKDVLQRMRDLHELALRRATTISVKQYLCPGRNEPCPCGSGEKFKRCCLPRGPHFTERQEPT